MRSLGARPRRLVPGLKLARTASAWAGLRPGSPDGLPILGLLPGWANVWVATGHFRNGILLSAITGKLMAASIERGAHGTHSRRSTRRDSPARRADRAENHMTSGPARIHFTGGPGAGKTTMARALAERLGVPYYDLDGMLLDGERRWVAARAVTEVAATLPAIAARPGWVSDGAYLEWTEPLLRAADVVFLVNTPGRLALYRVFVRHIKADRARNNRFPGLASLPALLEVVRGLLPEQQSRHPERLRCPQYEGPGGP